MKLLRKITAAAAAIALMLTAAPAYTYAAPSAAPTLSQQWVLENVVSESDAPSFGSEEEAGVYFRSQLRERSSTIVFIIPRTGKNLTDTVISLLDTALAETDSPVEGDYLRMAISSYNCSSKVSTTRMMLTFKMEYHSDAQQEKQLTSKINSVLDSLKLGSKSDFDKANAIYNYIASSVVYADDLSDTVVFSAYGALVNGEAVCQGFAQLLYRMLGEAGVKSRIIEGKSSGVNHAWNIAEIDGSFYLMDVTWDSTFKGKSRFYFLKGTADFDSFSSRQTHETGSGNPSNPAIYPDYTSDEFNSLYPIPQAAFNENDYTLGDVDRDGYITAADASAVLKAYAVASATGRCELTSLQRRAADMNKDGKIDAVDAAAILRLYTDMA